ncbi:MAG: alpha/beta fold hydrolase, partial [Vulcanimicrobiaceae bacterium]
GGMSLWKFGRIVLGGPESSIFDLANIRRGFTFSLDAMWAEVSALNLMKVVPALQIPVFFFLGATIVWSPRKPASPISTC